MSRNSTNYIRLLSLVTAVCMCICNFSSCGTQTGGEMRDITTMELVREMGVGINLGNTFESMGSGASVQNYETAWGSPVITQEMIQGYADCGFGVLRVPVAGQI